MIRDALLMVCANPCDFSVSINAEIYTPKFSLKKILRLGVHASTHTRCFQTIWGWLHTQDFTFPGTLSSGKVNFVPCGVSLAAALQRSEP